MLAGNIPGRTQTMAIAVYSAVQGGNRELAYKWVAVLCLISFATIMAMNYWSGDRSVAKRKAKVTGGI
jgi:molybdate transport system permease protein